MDILDKKENKVGLDEKIIGVVIGLIICGFIYLLCTMSFPHI